MRTLLLPLPLVLLSCGGSLPADSAPDSGGAARGAAPGRSSDWLATVRARIAADAHRIVPDGEGYVASLPATGTVARFGAGGVTFGAGDDGLRLRFAGWGAGERLAAVTAAAPALGDCADDTAPDGSCIRRLEYAHPGVTEWWVGRANGVEFGWTVEAPPAGGDDLAFAMDVDGADWLGAAGEGAELVDAAGRTWTVSGAVAWDARGAPLRATVRVDGDRLWVDVDAAGAVYPVTVDPLMSTASWMATGEAATDFLGSSVSGAGDVNGDGYDDVIVGAPYYDSGSVSDAGRAYVYFGSSSGLATAAAWTATGEAALDGFGYSVSTAGDVNGDGYDDVIVSTPAAGDSGRAYVYLGSSSGLTTSAAWTAAGTASGEGFGYSASTAGDVNADGYDDVIVGAPHYDGGAAAFSGRAYVYLGSSSGLATSEAWSVTGGAALDEFAYSVSEAGDVNGDSYDDVIVGAYGYDNGANTEAGRAYVYLGSARGPSTSAAWTATGGGAGDILGWSVSGAGDVNDDGYADVIVGAYCYDNGSTYQAGRADVYLGSASGLASSAAWTAIGEATQGWFGQSVSSAGDVNGDGYDDVIVGKDGFDYGSATYGGAFLYLGSASGLATSAAWTATGEWGYFGSSVSHAGDVNGDGYDDVLVGELDVSAGAGRAYLYLGYDDADGDGYYAGGDGTLGTPDCDDHDPALAPYPTEYVDRDADGYGDAGTSRTAPSCAAEAGWSLLSTDCDDYDDGVNPGATEVCDAANTDDDCANGADDLDPNVDHDTWSTWHPDGDGDTFGRGGTRYETYACDAPAGYVALSDDCDDTRADVNPAALEQCDGAATDEDCDSLYDDDDNNVDPATYATFHYDGDEDGYGAVDGLTAQACATPDRYAADATDCNDADPAIHPGAAEVCDPRDVDENCNGQADDDDATADTSTMTPYYPDVDGDSYGADGSGADYCDKPDDWATRDGDCDDGSPDINPAGQEVCDDGGLDEDCDGLVNDADPDADVTTWYRDADQDGYGDDQGTRSACTQPEGYLALGGDCADQDPAANPAATEVPGNTVDENCDGLIDPGEDGEASNEDAKAGCGCAGSPQPTGMPAAALSLLGLLTIGRRRSRRSGPLAALAQ